MDKLKVFKKELGYITYSNIREFTEKTILKLPDYFFTVPASSTARYHPKFSLGEGGLCNHVRVACTIAMDLMQLEMMNSYSDLEKDVVISSLLLHDGLKHGWDGGKYTVAEHPLLIAEFINSELELANILDNVVLEMITGCLKSHMGEFNTYYKTKQVILPNPKVNYKILFIYVII